MIKLPVSAPYSKAIMRSFFTKIKNQGQDLVPLHKNVKLFIVLYLEGIHTILVGRT